MRLKCIIIIIFFSENVAFFSAKLGSNVWPSTTFRTAVSVLKKLKISRSNWFNWRQQFIVIDIEKFWARTACLSNLETKVLDGTIVRQIIRVKRCFREAWMWMNNSLFLWSWKITLFKINIKSMWKERCKIESNSWTFWKHSKSNVRQVLFKSIKAAWFRTRGGTWRSSIFCNR